MSRRQKLKPLIAIVLLAIIVPIGMAIARDTLIIDKPTQCDVILVAAGDFALRSNRALQLASQGFGRKILVDEGADVLTYGRTLAERRIEQTSTWPVPVTVCPVRIGSTFGESRECDFYLQKLGARRVLIVTSDFHTRRALATFQKTSPSISFSVASAPTDYSSAPWWSFSAAATAVREWGGLLWLKTQ